MELADNFTESEIKWIKTFFDICNVISMKSKDPSTKVGCVITSSANSVISMGFNGFPIGVNDDVMYEDGSVSKRYVRPEKYLWTSHAEENAIAFAARNGVSLNCATLYVNRMTPCTRCTRLIIQSGIKRVYVNEDAGEDVVARWKEDNDIANQMMKEAGVEIIVFKNL